MRAWQAQTLSCSRVAVRVSVWLTERLRLSTSAVGESSWRQPPDYTKTWPDQLECQLRSLRASRAVEPWSGREVERSDSWTRRLIFFRSLKLDPATIETRARLSWLVAIRWRHFGPRAR